MCCRLQAKLLSPVKSKRSGKEQEKEEDILIQPEGISVKEHVRNLLN